MYYDSHCHLDFSDFDRDRGAVFQRARDAKVSQWMLAGVQASRWSKQRALCAQEDGCVWSAGVHPLYVEQYSLAEWSDVLAAYETAFVGSFSAVAVGEIGLHGRPSAVLDLQTDRLNQQLEIARCFDKPIIFHIVKAHQEMLAILRRFGPLPRGGVVHGFTGGPVLARCYLNLGLDLGINGRWLHGGGRKVLETINEVNLERLLIESDAPDQSYERGQRNEPTSIINAARLIGRQKQLTTDSVLVQCSNNANRLFSMRRSKGE